ncbi:MAG TPA: ATP-binding protein [Candidatus Polarisedimenticolia bacterium]|jgi:signal transduction histidine kinase|nr:ATP-binding protein [Candidatus Polarisedimenticolia bacterium]
MRIRNRRQQVRPRAALRRRKGSRLRTAQQHGKESARRRAARRSAGAIVAGRMKDELLLALAHELRTRLHAMLGWLQLLRNDALDAEQSEHAIQVVHRNAEAQVRLIEEAIDASRLVVGPLPMVREPVAIGAILEAAVDAATPESRRRHVALEKDLPAGLPVLHGNPGRLRQIVENVLENAVRFTPSGGHVRVRAAAERGRVRIEVRDDGIGIARADLRSIFDGLRRAAGGTRPEHGGLGLGLAITRHLVRSHRGSIRVTSAGPGRGTVVTISLPIATSVKGGPVPRGDDGSLPILKDVTALVVDDHEDSSELLAAFLERRGALVLRAADAGAAIDTLATSRADLLIADIAMPGMDGQELIRRVRKAGNAIPAIALSAHARPEDRDRALRAGFDAYCTKPVDAQEILKVIASLNTR